MADEIMKYPDFSGGAFVVFLILAAAALVGFLWLRLKARKQLGQDIELNRLLTYGRKRSLDKPELRFLRNFFLQLAPGDRPRLMVNRPFFKERLRRYLIVRGQLSARARVKVYQKLFPAIDYRLEIIDSADLQPGELCSLGGRRLLALARVEEANHEKVRLRLLEGGGADDFPEGLTAGIFAYRPLLGEFLLRGKIFESHGQTAVFRFGGKVEAKYEIHLMIERTLDIQLRALRPHHLSQRTPTTAAGAGERENAKAGADAAGIDDGSELDAAVDGTAPEAAAESGAPGATPPAEFPVIEGTTERISDRALLVRLQPGNDTQSLRRLIGEIELWGVELMLDGSYLLKTAGSLYPGRGRGQLLFRYRDMPESDHRALFEFIKRSGGVRERI